MILPNEKRASAQDSHKNQPPGKSRKDNARYGPRSNAVAILKHPMLRLGA